MGQGDSSRRSFRDRDGSVRPLFSQRPRCNQCPEREKEFILFSESKRLFNLLPTPVGPSTLLLHPWAAPRCVHSPDNAPRSQPRDPAPFPVPLCLQPKALCLHLHPVPQQPCSSPALLRANIASTSESPQPSLPAGVSLVSLILL